MEEFDIVVIGAGSGGLVVAIGAAKAGKKTLLIEEGLYGGDCTNFGCIPSKSLIASAQAAHTIYNRSEWGLQAKVTDWQASGALERVHQIVASVRSHEDSQALEKKGVHTWSGHASFEGPHHIKVKLKDGSIQFAKGRSVVIATGSHPFIPPIKGLAATPYLTNETIFRLDTIPTSLTILGAGPIGCELGQAFCRLGSKVNLLQSHSHLLNKEEPEAQQLMTEQLQKEGIQLHLSAQYEKIEYQDHQFQITFAHTGEILQSQHLLVATGRRPSLANLGLETAGICFTERGIQVDRYGRTCISHIWAIGDVIGEDLFTHAAEHQARAVLQSLLVPWFFKPRLNDQPMPRVTFTDPEVASIGLTEKQACDQYGEKWIATYFVPFSAVDRAITTGSTQGFVKIVTKKWSGRILGATIVGERAGEMLCQIATAMYAKMPVRQLASLIYPYPTYSLAIRQAADQWLLKTILPFLRGAS